MWKVLYKCRDVDIALNPSSVLRLHLSSCRFLECCKHLLFCILCTLNVLKIKKFSVRKIESPAFIYYKRGYQITKCKCWMVLILWEHQKETPDCMVSESPKQ